MYAKVAEYIIKAGRAAANTKYGKAAVQKAEKMYNDYIKKLNKGQEQTKAASQGQASVKRKNLKRLGQGAVGGALLNEIYGGRGDGKAEVKERKSSYGDDRSKTPIKLTPYGDDSAKKTFKDAFSDARSEGKKTFTFEGKRYTTEVAGAQKKEAPKPKAKAPVKKKSNVLSETDASTARSYNRGGVIRANAGASVPPNRKSRS